MRSSPGRMAAWALAAVSVLTLLAVTSVALAAALREAPAPSAPADPYTGWQQAGHGGASYRVPRGWHLHPPGERVSYRDDSGRAQARGAALSTYERNACPGGVRLPGAWAALAEPVRAGDVAGVARAAARQWARGFATGEVGTGRIGSPRVTRVRLADGHAGVVARLGVDLRGLDAPRGCSGAELAVVAVADEDLVRLLVTGRHRGVDGALPEGDWVALQRSLSVQGAPSPSD